MIAKKVEDLCFFFVFQRTRFKPVHSGILTTRSDLGGVAFMGKLQQYLK